MIQETRIQRLNNKDFREGDYVLYWMQSAQRAEYNHALEYSILRANDLGKPVVVTFGLTDKYPEANLRHYYFMLEGLRETKDRLAERGIKCIIKKTSPDSAAIELSKKASLVVVDGGWTRIQQNWRRRAAKKTDCLLEQVETNVIVPAGRASYKQEYSAGTFRPKITSRLKEFMVKLRHHKPKKSSLSFDCESFDISDIDTALTRLHIDRSVKPVCGFRGGTKEAKRRLRKFIRNKLEGFSEYRNDPSKEFTSGMSPFLHFGQISPVYIALEVSKSKKAGCDEYLEELIVRRELSSNFICYNDRYDEYDALPHWAKNTLNLHSHDPREYVYPLKKLENGDTHDDYWNAAQKEMVLTGKMHGYMRMYWGKKILEWSETPKKGFQTALYLNNRYELDGRDANGYAGVAWCFGLHDRAWKEREVFGKVRYMNAAGLKRKFDVDKYVDKVADLEKQ